MTMLNTITGPSGNVAITESVTHADYTKTDFIGGIDPLDESIITNTQTASGIGIPFPISDFTLINRGSSDNLKTIYDIIGINYDDSKVYKVEDIYGNDSEGGRSGLETLTPSISHNNISTFTNKNKTTHRKSYIEHKSKYI